MTQSAAYEIDPPRGSGAGGRNGGRRSRTRWRPLEIVAVVLGFIVWWPVGLGLLVWKLWRARHGQNADIIQAARNLEENVMHKWPEKARSWGCGARGEKSDWTATSWGGVGRNAANWAFSAAGVRRTGNTAFDDWRDAELARLEEERRKLEAAEREFSDFIDNLRRARDREEFDHFMRARTNPSASPANGEPPAKPGA